MEEGEEEEFLSQSESTDEQQETASQPPDSEPPAAKKGRKTTKKTADAVSKKTVNQNPKKGTSDPCLCCGECCAKGQLAVKCVDLHPVGTQNVPENAGRCLQISGSAIQGHRTGLLGM